jgi:hypothetical protein
LQPSHRSRWFTPSRIIVTVLIAGGAGWLAWRAATSGPDVRVELVDVGGYKENMPIWMPFRVMLRLINRGNASITIRRIDVEPDLDNFNEAYGSSSPYDLSPPMLLEPGARREYDAGITLLNANQLPERTYMLVFTVRLRTDAGDIVERFPGQFMYFRDPAERAWRR